MQQVKTTCPYCGVGCGVIATVAEERVAVIGDPLHPANLGRLCSKGAALGETLGPEQRLLHPTIGGERVSWRAAITAVAEGFSAAVAEHGPDAVALYVSGQLLTEDYYVANKWLKGFIGSANIDTNSRLCMASSVAGHKRAFGSDTVPGTYEDLELADLVVLVGSNLAWCHPVLYQRLAAAKKRRPQMRVVVVDPRRTATCDLADLHLAIAPGSDTALFNGLLLYLCDHFPVAWEALNATTEGVHEALAAARQDVADLAAAAARCGLSEQEVESLYRWFCATEKSVTVYSQGVNQSSYGSDKVNAIINAHLLTGRIGRPGMGPFSVTGQPNAMGGREVGGLANQLAAHMDFAPADVERVGRFWGAHKMATQPGLKAVDLFRALHEGRIKALWIMATNPVVSLPDADFVKAALERCPLVVVSDVVDNTDTVALAHIRLPALGWGEKEGTVTNSERCISRQRRFVEPPREARADWWMVSEVAKAMGFGAAFDYQTPAQIFREHAALSGFENGGRRDFDISALAEISDAAYEQLIPVRWPVTAAASGGSERLLGDGRYFTPSAKGRFIAVGPRQPGHAPCERYPLWLNTGRIRDQWHTMTRTARAPKLNLHRPEPYVELHPQEATAYGVAADELVQVSSAWGEIIVRARITADQQPGSIFIPMHWCAPYAAHGRVATLVNPVLDPVSGQPEAKHTPVAIAPYRPRWQGFLVSWGEPSEAALASCRYWVKVRLGEGWRTELAGEGPLDEVPALLEALAADAAGDEVMERLRYSDPEGGSYRLAGISQQRLRFCAFSSASGRLPERDWLQRLLAKPLEEPQRRHLLSGRPPQGQDVGRTVCACFGVGLNTIVDAVLCQQLTTPEAVGQRLQAGTNCGSCVPELRDIIAAARAGRAA